MTVSAGDKLNIRAADWNTVQEVLRWWRKSSGEQTGGIGGKKFPSEVSIKNTTASDVSAFGVLGIGSPIIDIETVAHERFNGSRLDGTTPSHPSHLGKFAVLQEPGRANGGLSQARISGHTIVRLNITSADDTTCDIEDGITDYLTTSQNGSAQILWKSSGTGSANKWGVIRFGSAVGDKPIRFRLSATLSVGGSAAANILTFNGTTYDASAGTIYVFDWYSVAVGVSTRGMFQGVSGMEGIGLRRETPSVAGQEQYDIIWMEQYAWDCEVTLTSDPTFSGTNYASDWTATATVNKSFHQGVSPGSSITIHDDQNMYPFAKSGALAKVIRTEHEASAPYYKVVVCQQLALYCTANLSGALCGSLTASVTDVTVLSPSPFNIAPSVSTVNNPKGHAGVHGDEVKISLDRRDASYFIDDMERHAVGVVKEFAISSNYLYLQACYRTIYTEICDTTTYCTDMLHLRNFNWWCSGNYYQYCSGSGAGSGSGGSGGGGGDTICGCSTIAATYSTLTCQIWYPGSCWHGQSVTLTWDSVDSWDFTGTILGDTWTIELRCSGDLVSGSYLHIAPPTCITGGSGDISGPGSSYSCSPVLAVYRYYTKSSNTGCSSCGNSSTPEYWEFRVSS